MSQAVIDRPHAIQHDKSPYRAMPSLHFLVEIKAKDFIKKFTIIAPSKNRAEEWGAIQAGQFYLESPKIAADQITEDALRAMKEEKAVADAKKPASKRKVWVFRESSGHISRDNIVEFSGGDSKKDPPANPRDSDSGMMMSGKWVVLNYEKVDKQLQTQERGSLGAKLKGL